MYIRVKVIPGAKKELFKKINEDHFEISVKEKPIQNLANNRIIELLATYYSIPIKKVRIINGHHSPTKLLVVDQS